MKAFYLVAAHRVEVAALESSCAPVGEHPPFCTAFDLIAGHSFSSSTWEE